ncbi:hypothetical protein G3545_05820 [Starkeya sp. ORNL1]|uniref:glycine zipper domain-containing protein n=1 Tax=Starkeya sp. ORNL1 TaxID=2709380 RepID=UPI001463C779|nr:glycine zipper domain-containing protein [Starkeya sp. ORNL1]QJP13207.1 hypothetical protein G3545_05820 [Starkeya sp. ORNL1]
MFRTSLLAAVIAVGALLAAPASAQNNTTRGAVIGGATGAVIGGVATGRAGGAVAGAVIGGVAGGAIGASQDRRNRRSYHFWRGGRCYFRASNGRITRVSNNRCR